jgi:hypothetical protein
MSEEARPPPSTLKGRLADVYFPALVDGALEALSRRLGNRATVDDPVHGRASSVASLEALVAKSAAAFAAREARYRHVYSTTGVDRDAAEGVLSYSKDGATRELPLVVIAERRRLREIELRLYYAQDPGAPRDTRGPLVTAGFASPLPAPLAGVVDALRRGEVDLALASFEEDACAIDPYGVRHPRQGGALGALLASNGRMDVIVVGSADDGRTCAAELTIARGGRQPAPAVLSFERGDSGLVRELRVYWD